MTTRLLIVGAGGLGRETYGIARHISKVPYTYVEVKGFLDDRDFAPDSLPAPILGSVETYQPQQDDSFIVAIGDPVQRRHYAEKLEARGVRFCSLIAPETLASEYDRYLDTGCMLGFFITIAPDVSLGRHVYMPSHISIGHDVRIGDYCHIGSFTFIGGGATLGQGVTVHPKATILPGVIIGDGATIGATSVVMSNVKPGQTVFGNPALPVPK